MEDYKLANLKKYAETNERNKFVTHPSKVVGMESFRRHCREFARRDERVLDIGGGAGLWTEILHEEGLRPSTYACDLSLSMLKQRNQRDVGVCADMEHLPFKDDSFERVFFFASLHHVNNTGDVLKEAVRILRPSGYLVLHEPTSLRLLLLGRGIEPVDDQEFCFSLLYLFRALRSAGLEIVYRRHQGVFLRLLPAQSKVEVHRIADRLDDILNKVPILRWLGVLGHQVAIVAQKT